MAAVVQNHKNVLIFAVPQKKSDHTHTVAPTMKEQKMSTRSSVKEREKEREWKNAQFSAKNMRDAATVSYTHLTLPTKRIV